MTGALGPSPPDRVVAYARGRLDHGGGAGLRALREAIAEHVRIARRDAHQILRTAWITYRVLQRGSAANMAMLIATVI